MTVKIMDNSSAAFFYQQISEFITEEVFNFECILQRGKVLHRRWSDLPKFSQEACGWVRNRNQSASPMGKASWNNMEPRRNGNKASAFQQCEAPAALFAISLEY